MTDNVMTATQTAGSAQEFVSSVILEYLNNGDALAACITDYSNLWKKGDTSVTVHDVGGVTFASITDDGSDRDSQRITETAIKIDIDQWKQATVKITDPAQIFSVLNQPAVIVNRFGIGVKEHMDEAIATLILAGASASNPDNIIQLGGDGYDSFDKTTILNFRKKLNESEFGFDGRFIGIAPEDEAEVLAIEGFVDASKYGNANAVQNGIIGRLYGFEVKVHNKFVAGSPVAWHKSAVGFCLAGNPEMESQRLLLPLCQLFSCTMYYGLKVLRDSGIVLANATGTL